MNDELQDFKLKSSESKTPPDSGAKRKPIWPYLIGAIILVILVVAFLKSRDDTEEPVAEPAIEQPAVSAPVEEDQEETELEIGEVPGLDTSDDWLRMVLQQLSTHPELAQWLLNEEMIRMFVVVVDNVAEGTLPSRHLEVLAPDEGFRVRESGGETYVDSASYHRYDRMVDVIESIDTDGAAQLYGAMRPLAQQAYEDLGYPGQSFEAALTRAFQRILAVPVITEPIEVKATVAAYSFDDDSLEELSPAAKQFLRLGPDNLRRLQTKIRQLARASGISID